MPKIFPDFAENKAYYIIILVSVFLGTVIRLNGLGVWTLALDEYYIIASSENILKHGVPQFTNGGYYSRGILLQYLISFLISLGIKAEFAGRIFSVVASLITIPPIYLIAKRIGNIKIATLAVVIFSFSIWHIEFARFARMYSPFQAIFMWYIYFALLDFTNKNLNNYKWLLFLSFLSLFVYEGSIFLVVFNFIPFILQRRIKVKYLLFTIFIFVSSIFINTFGFRKLLSNPRFPPEYLEKIGSQVSNLPIRVPQILFPYSLENLITIIGTTLLVTISVIILFRIYKHSLSNNFWNIYSLIFLGVLLLFNQFGLFILSLLILNFWGLLEIKLTDRKTIILLTLIFAINLFYWYLYGITYDNWYNLFDDFSSYQLWGVTKRLVVGFFNYPHNYYSLLNYFHTLPLLVIFSSVLLLYLMIKSILTKNHQENVIVFRFLIGTLLFFLIISNIPPLLYDETRYTFFAVPLVMILVIYSSYDFFIKFLKDKIIANIIYVSTIVLVFYFSRDFNLYHLLNVESEEVNYRMIYDSNYMKKHLYRRWDIKTPTDYVKKNINPNDLVLINENSLEYYLPRVDYFNFNYRHQAFPAISVEEGTKERWSNAKLIYTNKDLINFIENRETTIWYLVYPEFWLYEIEFYERYKENLVYEGIDGMIKVFKFSNKLNPQI